MLKQCGEEQGAEKSASGKQRIGEMNALFKGGEQSSEVIIRAKLKALRGGGNKKK